MSARTRTCSHRLANGTAAALVLAICAVAGVGPAAIAAAGPPITVKADQATIVALGGDPATVVIGNSLFADITLKKGMIVIHGRQWGTTNVIILDKENEELANFELNVVRGGSQNVTVRKGISSFSFLCAPSCEGALQVGDNADHFGNISSAMATKLQLSTGATDISAKE